MKTLIQNPVRELIAEKARPRIKWLSLLLITLLITSCYTEPWYGRDGRPGYAFLTITWIDAKPDYIDAGTGDIPPVFEYGKYYSAWPGYYTLYYDGSFWNGQAWASYAWEVDYEIWAVNGEPGGPYCNGANGADNYFTVECSPYGPWVYGPGYKSTELPEGYELKESSEDRIVIEKKGPNFGITLIYKKVPARKLAE